MYGKVGATPTDIPAALDFPEACSRLFLHLMNLTAMLLGWESILPVKRGVEELRPNIKIDSLSDDRTENSLPCMAEAGAGALDARHAVIVLLRATIYRSELNKRPFPPRHLYEMTFLTLRRASQRQSDCIARL